jgi:hypothetical protein
MDELAQATAAANKVFVLKDPQPIDRRAAAPPAPEGRPKPAMLPLTQL